MKNLTKNRHCRFSDNAAYVLCKFSAADSTSAEVDSSPRKAFSNQCL